MLSQVQLVGQLVVVFVSEYKSTTSCPTSSGSSSYYRVKLLVAQLIVSNRAMPSPMLVAQLVVDN